MQFLRVNAMNSAFQPYIHVEVCSDESNYRNSRRKREIMRIKINKFFIIKQDYGVFPPKIGNYIKIKE